MVEGTTTAKIADDELLRMTADVVAAYVSNNSLPTAQLPTYPLKFGAFVARFDPGGTFTLQGQGWPALSGNWKSNGPEIELSMSGGPGGCDGTGRYQFRVEGKRVSFDLVSDDCKLRRMIIDRSTWSPAGEKKTVPVRRIERTEGARPPSSPNPTDADRGASDMIAARSSHVAARPAYSGPRRRWLPRNRWSHAQTTIGAVTIVSFVPMPSAHATMAAVDQRREVRPKPDPTDPARIAQ